MPAAREPHARVPAPQAYFFSDNRSWLLGVVLAAAIVAAYWNSLNAPFLFDDTGAVVTNPTIRHLGSLATLTPPSDGSTTTGRPVVNFSYAINYAISGDRPWSYHASNVAIHLLAALVLMGLVRRTLLLAAPALLGGSRRVDSQPRVGRGSAFWQATVPGFFAALLWALHPLQTESVVCIAQRTESLCGLFYLLTLYSFVRGAAVTAETAAGVRGPSSRRTWLVVSVAACLAGMGTKEVMVTAPIMVLLYDRTFIAGSFAAAWRERWRYYLILAGTWLLLAWLVARGGGGRGASAGFGLGVSSWSYLLKQSEAIVHYLGLSIWPHPLVLDYGTAVVGSLAQVWWQAGAVGALLAMVVWALVKKPVAGFLGAWFFLILAPSSSVIPLVAQTMAEHRMYLPLAAIVVAGVLGLRRWAFCCPASPAGVWANIFLAGLAATFGCVTVARNHDYRDAVAIWADNVAKYPQGARGHNNLGWALQQAGRSDAANAEFARAIALQPDYVTARYSWGVALLDQGRTDAAIDQFETVVRLAPDHADAWLNLGNALMQAQRAAEAVPCYETAVRLKPAADAHYDLGVALVAVDRPAGAGEHFRAALQMDPTLPEAHYQLGRIADQGGQPAEAEAQYNATLRLAPNHAAAHARLGLLLARSNRLDAAGEQLQAAVRLKPDDADARANLGNILLLQGHPAEAIAQYEEALRLRPEDIRVRESIRLARESIP